MVTWQGNVCPPGQALACVERRDQAERLPALLAQHGEQRPILRLNHGHRRDIESDYLPVAPQRTR
jgi:hypothetical protein